MGRNRFLILLIILALSISACSTREDFVVINRSDGVTEITYRLKNCNPESSRRNVNFVLPAKLSIEEFQRTRQDWGYLSEEQFEYDDRTCVFTVSLKPNEVLLVDHAYNYGGHNSERADERFNLEALGIVGVKGEVHLEGKQTQTFFQEDSQGDYVVVYD